jgi:hypothetical protein
MTVIGEGMAQLHELYESAVAAGFTKGEAMTLIVRMALGRQHAPEDDQ